MILVSEAFREASAAEHTGELTACLDFLNELPFFKSYKQLARESLRIKPGSRILDVGCGVGYDAIGMAKGHPAAAITGADISDALLKIARQRADTLPNVTFAAANGAMLPFADDTFDAVRIDRSLQHAERPDQVIMEMARVAKGGGVVFAVEPDWGTFVLYNGDDKTSDLLIREWTRSIRNPSIGRELQQLFVACAVHNITVRAHPLILTDYPSAAAVYDLERLVSHCVSQNIISASEASNWKARSENATGANYFFSHLCIVEVVGVA